MNIQEFKEKGNIVYMPQRGFQDRFVSSNLDVVFGGGAMNSGKSFAACLSVAEPLLDPNFRAVFLRRNLQETKVAGGLLQEMKNVYGDVYVTVKESENPRMVFPSGAFVDFTHISDEKPSNLLERIKGWQYDLIYFDEGTSYEWSTFRLLFSRNRGTAKYTGKIRLTTNPKKNHWIREFIKDYIGADGYIKPDWDGRVRYFYIKDKSVKSVVWGDSKEEVYLQCKNDIDEALAKFKGKDISYEALIKSFTFYLGSTSENVASIGTNAGYLGSVAAMGAVERKQNLLGNWDVVQEEDDMPISYERAASVFNNDPRINGDKWITADLADTGTDNTVIFVWNGLHIAYKKIICTSTPRVNVEAMRELAEIHEIPDNHIIYDGVRAAYVYDYLPEAIAFKSYNRPWGMYARMYYNLKDVCYARLVEVIKREMLSFEDKIAEDTYPHAKMNTPVSIKTEFIEECSVVKFKELPGGKKTLLNKKEMNLMLGRGRSMDVLDPIAMRMYPLLSYEYGQELVQTEVSEDKNKRNEYAGVDIYDNSTWC